MCAYYTIRTFLILNKETFLTSSINFLKEFDATGENMCYNILVQT